MQVSVIPIPSDVQACNGVFSLTSARAIYLLAPLTKIEGMKPIGRYLSEALGSHTAFRLPVLQDIQHASSLPYGSIRLVIDPERKEFGDEAYRIEIDKSVITIIARQLAGLFYGSQTLIQIVNDSDQQGITHEVPCMIIEDKPRFVWRGFMLDSARHMQSVTEIKEIIQTLATLKYNRFHWHLTDDQGWRLPINKYPLLTDMSAWRGQGTNRYGGYYTHDQIREIVDYANERFITVIPEIDIPGHCNAALHAYPSLSCSGDPIKVGSEGGLDAFTRHDGRRLFCAGKDEAVSFIKDVLAEVVAVFKPTYIHLGGDERPSGIWEKCPCCQQRMKEKGLRTEDDLELWLADQITKYAHEHLNVQTIGWGDNLKKAGMPSGQIVQGWLEGQSGHAASIGRKTINSFHEWVYLDYPASEKERQGKPDWMPLLPIEKVYDFEPLPEGLEASKERLVLGGEAPIWTECVQTYDQLVAQVLPRLTALSEVLWSPKNRRNFGDFARRVARAKGKNERLMYIAPKKPKISTFSTKKLDFQRVKS